LSPAHFLDRQKRCRVLRNLCRQL